MITNQPERSDQTSAFVGIRNSNPILLVEDNANDAELTETTLSALNLVNEVVMAPDGASAMEFLFGTKETPPKRPIPALILLDLHLPDLDGLSILRAVKSDPSLTSIPVIVLTGSQRERDQFESQRWAALAYIEKPLTATRLAEVFREVGIVSGGGEISMVTP